VSIRFENTSSMKLVLFSLLAGYAAAFTALAPQGQALVKADIRSLTPLRVSSLEDIPTASKEASAESPQALVSTLLNGLLRDADIQHRMKWLLNVSTHKWRSKIYDAIGAPSHADEDKVAAALTSAMRNPNNQFAILLGMAEDYTMDFASDVVDYGEGKCWLECRLYDQKDGELLVVSGWELQKNPISGGWLIDRIDWQDFRDAFYPGLGREEWARAFV
jgi:hypothetical protein